MGPIQVIPRGLLGLLQLKQTGANPSDLTNTVQPVLELADLYLQNSLQDEIAITAGGALPQCLFSVGGSASLFTTGPLTCPQNELWWVYQFSIQCTFALAADYLRICPMIQSPQGAQIQVGLDSNDVVNARVRRISAFAQTPFWLQSGWSLGVIAFDANSAATTTVFGRARIARLQV